MLRPADELGNALVGRTHGELVRERIEQALESGETVVVDFDGVEFMSPSFADEVFGKLPEEPTESGRLRFENLADDLVQLAHFVVAQRRQR